jgi:hypothetical protein
MGFFCLNSGFPSALECGWVGLTDGVRLFFGHKVLRGFAHDARRDTVVIGSL